jgi:hypothetical protein
MPECLISIVLASSAHSAMRSGHLIRLGHPGLRDDGWANSQRDLAMKSAAR